MSTVAPSTPKRDGKAKLAAESPDSVTTSTMSDMSSEPEASLGVVPTKKGISGPSHALSGLGSGLGIMRGGLFSGAAALVAAPVVGVQKGVEAGGGEKKSTGGAIWGGLLGGIVGLGAGVAGLALGTVGGVAGGTLAFVQGLINTPGTLRAIISDDDLHGKEQIDLSQVENLRAEEEERYSTSRAYLEHLETPDTVKAADFYTPTTKVKEMGYYEALEIKPDASATEVKRAYYRLAMKEHPDRGGDKDRFQRIGDAYQVLSVSVTRRTYDTKGVAGLDRDQMADPALVFAMMFGDNKFRHLVGELTIVHAARMGHPPHP